MSGFEEIQKKLTEFGQEHLLQFWSQLKEEERGKLVKDIEGINFKYVKKCFDECKEDMDCKSLYQDNDLEPVPKSVRGSILECDAQVLKDFEQQGLRLIGEGKVGLMLLAGGQGTRLGVKYPKGMYDVGLPSHKTLYQLMAERLTTLQHLAQKLTGKPCHIPWYIMTSESTRQTTQDFFKKHSNFGLKSENITFFNQSNLPCFDFDGKIILESPHKISMAPDGNGGLYRAMASEGVLDGMEGRGVEVLHAYCVDNILVKVADPVFVGFCASKAAKCGFKVVEKTNPSEAVGVLCKYQGKYHIAEYSEMPQDLAAKRDANDRLLYNCGSIANHFFSVAFIREIVNKGSSLRHHVARKKIPYCDQDGRTITPTSANGIKMEQFIFDVFQFTNDFAVWEVAREDEFSPLKNTDTAGKDCPTTSRQSIFQLHCRWLQKAGGVVVPPSGDSEGLVCEVSPLVSYAGEGLEGVVKENAYTSPIHITSANKQD